MTMSIAVEREKLERVLETLTWGSAKSISEKYGVSTDKAIEMREKTRELLSIMLPE